MFIHNFKFLRNFTKIVLISTFLTIKSLICSENPTEEGWRYNSSLILKIHYNLPLPKFTIHDFEDWYHNSNSIFNHFNTSLIEEINLFPIHANMAFTTESSKFISSDFESLKGCATSLFRFTPIIKKEDKLFMGKTISLTTALLNKDISDLMIDHPFQEMLFMSGFYDLDNAKGVLSKFMRPIDSQSIRCNSLNKKMFVAYPPLNPEKSLQEISLHKYDMAIRFLQRNYINPSLLRSNLSFRYIENINNSFLTKNNNYKPIFLTHNKTIESIKEREYRIKEKFESAKNIAFTTDILEAFGELEKLKKERRNFHNSSEANSYTCAEQAAIDYISDKTTIDYLIKSLNTKDEQTLGIIIHVHCSDTPCGTCSTSITRESEEKGLFSVISNNKPVKVVCTCSNHYKRKPPMLLYNNTNWLKDVNTNEAMNFSLNEKDFQKNLPYPIVLFEYNPNEKKTYINNKEYKNFEEAKEN